MKTPEQVAHRKAYLKDYRRKNREQIAAYMREWRAENPEAHRAHYMKPDAKLKRAIRQRLRNKLKNRQDVSPVRDLGCTIGEFRSYFRTLFTEGMSWDNYGEWHIDHILPLSSFDLTDREQILQAVHHTNLQPLWAEDNLTKGSS